MLRQVHKLDEIAKAKKIRTDRIIELLFAAEVLTEKPPKTRAEIEDFLETNRDKDVLTRMHEDLEQRLDKVLSK